MKISSILRKGVVLWISRSYQVRHQANDFALSTIRAKTPLVAVVDGVAGREAPSGAPHLRNTGFTLRHSGGALFLYNHCQLTVPVNSQVKRGQVIGHVDTAANQRRLGHNMKNGNEHCHFEVHPTGKWDIRDQPLSYFDRGEVKYRKQPACTSTPLNYKGIPDKQIRNPQKTSFILEKRGRDLWLTKLKGSEFGAKKIKVSRHGASWRYNYYDNSDKRVVAAMNKDTLYTVSIGAYKRTYHNEPSPHYRELYTKEVKKNAKLGKQIETLDKQIEILDKEVETLGVKLEKCIGEKEQYKKTNEGLNKKVQELKRDVYRLKKNLKECQTSGSVGCNPILSLLKKLWKK